MRGAPTLPAPTSQTPPAGPTTAQAGVVAAVGLPEVYQQQRERIYRYCCFLLRSPEDAEDAVQETFIRLARQLHRLTGDVSAYLTTVARSVCYDVIRERSRRSTSTLDDAIVAEESMAPERSAIELELARSLWERLSRDEKTFFAHTFAGFKHEEIARRTGHSVPAVSVGIFRARRRLREIAGAVGAAALLPLLRLWRRAAAHVQATATAMSMAEPVMAVSMLAGAVAMLVGTTDPAGAHPSSTQVPIVHHAAAEPVGPVAAETTPAQRVTIPNEHASPSSTTWSPANGAVLDTVGRAMPGAGASPADVQFTAVSTAPGSGGKEEYASGQDLRTCPAGGSCPVLFYSQDGGRTWTQRPGVGFTGGTVMIPAGFPSDPAVYVAGPQGLLVSRDGGASFSTASQLAGPSAVAPGGSPGHAVISIVQGLVWSYAEASGATSPGPPLPAGVIPESAAYVSPTELLVVGSAYEAAPTPQRTPVLVRCSSTSCAVIQRFLGEFDVHLAVPGDAAHDGLVLAYSSDNVLLSRDGGSTFATVVTDRSEAITAVGVTALGTGALRAVVAEGSSSLHPQQVLLADGDLASFSKLPATPETNSLTTVVPLPSGSVLAAIVFSAGDGYGLQCTSDAGRTWRPAC